MSVKLQDFLPINHWLKDTKGPKWDCCEQYGQFSMYLIDQSTGRKYLNKTRNTVRGKCFCLILGTPTVHAVAGVLNIAYRVMKLVLCLNFFIPLLKGEPRSFKSSLKENGKDLMRIIMQPLAFVGLELVALYGLFSPYDGRKLYATIERAQYGNRIYAPCFQPVSQKH